MKDGVSRGPIRVSSARRKAQQGSALLIVLVFAAVIAIMLYSEIPVTLFEARRQKEELLVERGNEYVRAVQLFYRRNRGTYPSSIEQLENTNNIRYLRERYTDPFTGKDDWRLLHAGPGGMLIDSVNPQVGPGGLPTGAPGANGQVATQQASSAFGSTTQSSFGQSSFGQSSFGQSSFGQSSFGTGSTTQSAFGQSGTGQNSTGQSGFGQGSTGKMGTAAANLQPSVVVPDLPPARPAAIQVSGSSSAARNTGADLDSELAALAAGDEAGQAGTSPMGRGASSSAMISSGQANGNSGSQNNVMQMMSPILTSPTSTTPPVNTAGGPSAGGTATGTASAFGNSGMGQMTGGGSLAGVASKAKGHSIKLVHDEDDYLKWEFYYDPTQDTTMRATLPTGMTPTTQTSTTQTPTPTSQQPTQATQQSPFGTDQTNGNSNGLNGTAVPPPPVSAPLAPAPSSQALPTTPEAGSTTQPQQ